ncbi:site-2 protease family protein [Nafulsella turpanensis]|uniref:site-2 protease family protein n=1 Tax=Nafulsella turpanensis TaxID=1265690 RepID=UPI000348A959|nr:site-2 protease family protein [Nafulsella turpanensis]
MEEKNRNNIWLHLGLFIFTFIATTFAGAEWRFGELVWMEDYGWHDFRSGLAFSFPLLLFLTVHEFGHYFTARKHKVKASLPYYIPFWFFGLFPSIGTMGAVIRIREFIKSRKQHFDIGIAGPLAGFVIALGVLFYGFTHLPPQEYIFKVHPEYLEMGADYAEEAYQEGSGQFYLGKNILFVLMEYLLVEDPSRMPNGFEIIHYPWLFAGFLGLFFTALNLLPIGQLDGGHILYGLVGYRKHKMIATALFVLLVFWAGLGFYDRNDADSLQMWAPLNILIAWLLFARLQMSRANKFILALSVVLAQLFVVYFIPGLRGYSGWILFAFLIGRFLGVYHPPALFDQPLSTGRKILGWLALLIFILCFSPEPFIVV